MTVLATQPITNSLKLEASGSLLHGRPTLRLQVGEGNLQPRARDAAEGGGGGPLGELPRRERGCGEWGTCSSVL